MELYNFATKEVVKVISLRLLELKEGNELIGFGLSSTGDRYILSP
jgi:hypothetical protein